MNNKKTSVFKAVSLTAAITSALFLAGCDGDSSTNTAVGTTAYEVWASDQSNSKAGETGIGVQGSFINIWNSDDVEAQIAGGATAKPVGCGVDANVAGAGPCDINDIFSGDLVDETGKKLSDPSVGSTRNGFGRLHGMLSDPSGKYMNFNLFKTTGDGGLVGIMDGETKTAIALFRVAKTTSPSSGGRSVHMSFWNKDGSALLIANLHGRLIERIDITRDATGKITKAELKRNASIGAGKNLTIVETSHAYTGNNALGQPLVSAISGDYGQAVFGNLTPLGNCKENGCTTVPSADATVAANLGPTGAAGGRPTNVIICPIVSDTGMIYITMAAGGLLVADTRNTPMNIVGEYGNNEANGVGCGGVHLGNKIWFDNGVSATGAGATDSAFGVYTIDDATIAAAANSNTPYQENLPAINQVYKDPTNTQNAGNNDVGAPAADSNTSGQIPGATTRRDAHGMIPTLDEKYLHVADRIQNTMEVFDVATETRLTPYDLTSANGDGSGGDGACAAVSVTDDPALPTNDPAPDLMGLTPDGKYIVVALRGPAPVTVLHGAQGSCPGVGMIELTDGGKSGKLVSVLRTTNTTDDAPYDTFSGGVQYTGSEHSDVHGATTRRK